MSAIVTNSWAAWVLAARPKTLGAISCPVILGSALAYAHGHFLPIVLALTLLCSFMLQILANVINDYGDFLKGSDTLQRLGPPRALQMGWITPHVMQRGIAFLLALIVLLGLLLVYRGGWPIFLIGMASIALCFWYTMGRVPLAYLGFSEIAIVFFFGPLPVAGAYYLQRLALAPELLALSISPACLSTALIMANNLRDIEEDRRSAKKTLAVRFGPRFSRMAISALVGGGVISPLMLVALHGYPLWLLGSALSLFPALRCLPILREPISTRYNLMFGGIGKALYGLSIMLGCGIIYGTP